MIRRVVVFRGRSLILTLTLALTLAFTEPLRGKKLKGCCRCFIYMYVFEDCDLEVSLGAGDIASYLVGPRDGVTV